MISDPHLMPDFRDSLEQALYRRANETAVAASPSRGRFRLPDRRFAWPVGLASAAAAVVAAVVLVLSGSSTPPASRTAVAGPRILSEPSVPVPAGITPGITARRVLGPDAEYLSAIPIPLGSQTGYAVRANTGWCVVVVDATTVCAPNAEIERIGVYAALAAQGGSPGFALLLVPPSVAPPTLVSPDGATRTLQVSRLGVVFVQGVKPGDTIVRHATDGVDESSLIP